MDYFRHLLFVKLNVREEQIFFRMKRNQLVSICLKGFSFFLFRKFIRNFRRLVFKFERTITKWFQFVRKKQFQKFGVRQMNSTVNVYQGWVNFALYM